ncbi:MAG: fibronectin type III domain-containing protein [Elusimicrobiota bacterium]
MDTRNSIDSGGERMTGGGFQLDSTVAAISHSTQIGGGFNLSSGLMEYYFYPGTISDVVVSSGDYAGSVDLTWTASGGNGSITTLTSYVIKWDTKPILTQAAFEGATTYAQVIVPKAPDGSESYTLTGLDRDTTIYVNIAARDADKNQSFLSNAASSVTAASALSIAISPSDLGIMAIDIASSIVHGTPLRVTHDGNVFEDYAIRATTSTANTPWALAGAPGTDLFTLKAGFHATKPSSTSYDATDIVTYFDKLSGAGQFSIDSSSTGTHVGIQQIRDLWLNILSPLLTSTTFQQKIDISITAQESP